MELKNYTYLGLLIFSIFFPLVLSFDKKVAFWKNWIYLFPAIIITAIPFLIWDVKFTEAGIWSFNHNYTMGIDYKGLPVEEWLFFLIIPYACMFIYEVLKAYFQNFSYPNFFVAVSLLLIVGFALLAYFYRDRTYTFLNFLFSAVFLIYIIFRNRFKQYLSHFYLAYMVSLIPFLLVNGVLTYLPVVEYNPKQNLQLFFISIPAEDFVYQFLLLLMNASIYEALKSKAFSFR